MDRAEALARALNDRERLAQVRVRQAQGLWNLWSGPGNLEAAIDGAREAFALAAPDDLRTRSYAQFLVGAVLLARGRFRNAVREFDAGMTLFTTVPVDAEAAGLVLPIRASIRAWEAEAYAALGEFGEALAAVDETQEIASELHHAPTQGIAGYIRGYVLLMQDEALSDWSRLIDLATELSMRPELAHCHLGLGRLYRRTGDGAKAEEHLTTARAMYREMNMGFWLETADAELGGVER